ncbi:hypothetical protein [Pontibacter toksunensis]
MKSSLTATEFYSRLRDITLIGDPELKGSPLIIFTGLNLSSKPFFGEFTESEFRLAKNSTILPTPYLIKGSYTETGEAGTNIAYEIKPIWFGYLWIRILPVLALILINLLLINTMAPAPLDLLIPINGFLLLMLFAPLWITHTLKKGMEKDFIDSLMIVKE